MALSSKQAVGEKGRQRGPVERLQGAWDRFSRNQSPPVEVAVGTVLGCFQGGILGFAMGSLTKSSMSQMQGNAAANPMAAQFQTMGGVWGQTRSLAALCGVSAGLSIGLKKYRGKEDVWTQMGSAAGGGVAYTLASGNATIPSVVNTALLLGLVSGGFYKVSQNFKSEHTDSEFEKGAYMLKSLGLDKYSKNVRRGQLTDKTIMLWNDSALQECKIPPGPRLLILHHLDQLRSSTARKAQKVSLPSPPVE